MNLRRPSSFTTMPWMMTACSKWYVLCSPPPHVIGLILASIPHLTGLLGQIAVLKTRQVSLCANRLLTPTFSTTEHARKAQCPCASAR